jgi:hypothetical protein
MALRCSNYMGVSAPAGITTDYVDVLPPDFQPTSNLGPEGLLLRWQFNVVPVGNRQR